MRGVMNGAVLVELIFASKLFLAVAARKLRQLWLRFGELDFVFYVLGSLVFEDALGGYWI